MSFSSARTSDDESLRSVADVVQDISARKRVALGLSPRRPTAKAAPHRPPIVPVSPFPPALLPVILVAIVGMTAWLITANLFEMFPSWWQINFGQVGAARAVAAQGETEPAGASFRLRLADNFGSPDSRLAQGDQPGQWRIELVPTEAVYRMDMWPSQIAWSLLGMGR